MNYFRAQSSARRKTGWLIFLFGFAVVSLICLSYFILLVVIANSQSDTLVYSPDGLAPFYSGRTFFEISMALGLIILMGSLSKTHELSPGGTVVAQRLGGRLIPQDSKNFEERRLLNVVEEMAIAAGMPIPQVYLLRDESINAFAAGLTPASAVIGVTRGTITLLSRAELQGVIAHEFSHILNGDMRLNMRLTGVLHGILMIGIVGYFLLRTGGFISRNAPRDGGLGAGVFFILGLIVGTSLLAIGYAGTFFGNWIKASVNRQREYLADSSAVQFTRDKDSIAGALKKIGGSLRGSAMGSASAPEYSHAYFADGIQNFWHSIFATHPPLEKRIRSIDPGWDGKFIKPQPVEISRESTSDTRAKKDTAAKIAATSEILSAAEQAISEIGTLNEANVEYVHELLMAIPDSLKAAAQSAYSARAVIYLILIRKQADKTLAWSLVNQHADKNMAKLAQELDRLHPDLDDKLKLPLLELSVNALLGLSTNQYIQFSRCIDKIIKADNKVDLNEWVVQRFVMQQLDAYFNLRQPLRPKYTSLEEINNAVEVLLSLIAYVEHSNDKHAQQAFDLGKNEIGAHGLKMQSTDALTLKALNDSLDSLMQLKPLVKPRFLKAFAAVVLANNKATMRGIEIIRTIASCMDCPMPPIRISLAS